MDNCIFCQIVGGDSPSWKVLENDHVYAFLCINPATRYHTLIIPKKHYINIFDIPDAELREVISLTRQVAKLFEAKLGIENCQIIQSSGSVGQQHVFHIHFHLVPRYVNDGQDVQWNEDTSYRNEFDGMLAKLK